MTRKQVAQSVILAGTWILAEACLSLVGCGSAPTIPDAGSGSKFFKLAQAPDNVLNSASPARNGPRFVWEELSEDPALLSRRERTLVTDDPFVPSPTNVDGEPFADIVEGEFDIAEDDNPFRASLERGDPFFYRNPELSAWVFVFPAEDAISSIPPDLRSTIINAFGEPITEEAYDGCRSNSAPLADAGVDKEVDLQTRVTLSGLSSSDVDGDPLSYRWEQVSGVAVVLERAVTSSPSFLPPEEGIYEFALTASDSCGLNDVDTVRISVGATVEAGCPTARARTDQSAVSEGAVVNLDGGDSFDTEGFALRYSWRQTGGSPVDLNAPSTATPSFTAPRVVQDVELTFELLVTNGSCSDTDTLTVTVLNIDLDAAAPVANAGASQNVNEGATTTLDGSFSADPSSLELTYSWSQAAGPTVTLSDSTAVQPTFIAPQVNEETTLTFTLRVSNGADTDTDSVNVLVRDLAEPLTVTATATPNSADVGDTVDLSGSASGGLLPFVFSWAQVSGPATVMLIGTAAVTPAPAVSLTLNGPGTVVYSLTVTDANGDTATTEVSISVTPRSPEPHPADTNGDFAISSEELVAYSAAFLAGALSPEQSQAWVDVASTIALATINGQYSDDEVSSKPNNWIPLVTTAPLVANAGADQSVDLNANPVGVNAFLNGTATGGDGNYIYAWSPTTGLSDPNLASPGFTAPSEGTFVFTLSVTDGSGNSNTDTVTLLMHRGEQTIHETASLGSVPHGAGLSIGASQFIGSRFHIDSTVQVTAVGGHVGSSGTIFAAIVSLGSIAGLPTGSPLDSGEVLASTAFDAGTDNDFRTSLSVTLAPGDYALVFGSGLYGATGSGYMPQNGTSLPGNAFMTWFNDGHNFAWRDHSAFPLRFVVKGIVIP